MLQWDERAAVAAGARLGVVGQRLQRQDLDEGADPSLLAGDPKPFEQLVCSTAPRLRPLRVPRAQQDHGQREVLVLADVGHVVVGGEATVLRPVEGIRMPAERHEQTCPQAGTGRTSGEKSPTKRVRVPSRVTRLPGSRPRELRAAHPRR